MLVPADKRPPSNAAPGAATDMLCRSGSCCSKFISQSNARAAGQSTDGILEREREESSMMNAV